MIRLITVSASAATSAAIVIGSGVLASKLGLIDLIASGYGVFGWIMLFLFVVPLLTLGTYRIIIRPREIAST